MSRIADFLCVVGPSGCGKSTLITKLMKEFPASFGYSVSHTTRGMRPGEENGVSYHFTDPETFKKLVAEGAFIEHAIVHDTMYGTSEASVRRVLDKNQVCMIDIDIVGAQNLRKHPRLKALVIWIMAPSFEENERRLRARGTDSEASIVKRLKDGERWVSWFEANVEFFDHHFVNDDLEECYEKFRDAVMHDAFLMAPHRR